MGLVARDPYKGLSSWMRPRTYALALILSRYGISLEIFSGRRSFKEQLQRKLKGWTSTLESEHLDGEAADFILRWYPSGERVPRDVYAAAGEVWERMGGRWGGNFRDPELARAEYEHFQRKR